MSLDYYLYCRKEYDDIIEYLHEIISKYELISDISTVEVQLEYDYEIFNPEKNKNFFIEKINHLKELKKLCDKRIIQLCDHDFVDDLIDISPDKSKCISYCRICEYTKDK